MNFIGDVIYFFLHPDKHAAGWVNSYQSWTRMILFAIIFCETGFAFTPMNMETSNGSAGLRRKARAGVGRRG